MYWQRDSKLYFDHILRLLVPDEFNHGQGVADFQVRPTWPDQSDSEAQIAEDNYILSSSGVVRFDLC